jgi:hypothetical protein
MNVHAIIVGIEHYDTLLDSVDIELDGPASDAVRFATLLLRKGVPPANLHMFVACLDEPSRRAEMDRAPGGAEVHFQRASRDCIETYFDTTLATINQPDIKGSNQSKGGQGLWPSRLGEGHTAVETWSYQKNESPREAIGSRHDRHVDRKRKDPMDGRAIFRGAFGRCVANSWGKCFWPMLWKERASFLLPARQPAQCKSLLKE